MLYLLFICGVILPCIYEFITSLFLEIAVKKIYIELSDICHLSCNFCPATKGKRGIMSVEDFGYCLEDALRFSRRIALHILGDPCALPNLNLYLEVARNKSKSPQIELVTSGAFFAKHSLDMLLSPPIYQLSISLEAGVDNFAHSSDKRFSVYLDSLTKVFDTHIANPRVFLNLRIQDKRTLQDRDMLQIITRFLAPFVDFGFWDRSASRNGINSGNAKKLFIEGKIEELLDAKGRIRLWKNALLVVKNSFVWAGFAPKNERKNHKCYALREQVGILSNGAVVPCCMDAQGEINLGNIFTTPLKQILSSKQAQNIIAGFEIGEVRENLCKTCGFWE